VTEAGLAYRQDLGLWYTLQIPFQSGQLQLRTARTVSILLKVMHMFPVNVDAAHGAMEQLANDLQHSGALQYPAKLLLCSEDTS
jgi:hypothetical protein